MSTSHWFRHRLWRRSIRFLGIIVALCLLGALATLGVRSLLTSVPEVAALVSDVVMPGATNGVGLADAARRLVPGIKIVLITGYAGPAPGDHLVLLARDAAAFVRSRV